MRRPYQENSQYPGYRFAYDGSIYSCWELIHQRGQQGNAAQMGKDWHLLKPWQDQRGYLRIKLRGSSGRTQSRLVHRMILEAFVGLRPQSYECRHLNDDKSDNRIANLRWGTRRENIEDAKRFGGHLRGERVGGAKLLRREVLEIRQIGRTKTQREVALQFGITRQAVCAILLRKTWGWL